MPIRTCSIVAIVFADKCYAGSSVRRRLSQFVPIIPIEGIIYYTATLSNSSTITGFWLGLVSHCHLFNVQMIANHYNSSEFHWVLLIDRGKILINTNNYKHNQSYQLSYAVFAYNAFRSPKSSTMKIVKTDYQT